MDKVKLITSSAYAAIASIVFVVVITIWAEVSVPLKDWLKSLSGHHWTSKSILSALLYVLATSALYVFLHKPTEDCLRRTLGYLLVVTAFGVVIITLFYTGYHFELF